MGNFIVQNKTGVHWLKGTIWTSTKNDDEFGKGATRYDTLETARTALAKAAKFNPKAAKGATFIEE